MAESTSNKKNRICRPRNMGCCPEHMYRLLSFKIMPVLLFFLLLSLGIAAPLHAESGNKKFTIGFLVGISGLGDQSFNDMAYAGLFKVKQEFDVQLIYENSEKTDEAFDAAMTRLIRKKSDIIVANGFYLKSIVETYAKSNPEIYFILQDAEITGFPNVVSILYSVNEGSFLAGAFAAMMTKSGHIGFIGGVDIPIMHSFRKGFRQGAKYVNPDVPISEKFISTAPDFSGFKDPAAAFKTALDFYSQGVDIIFAAAGLSGNGVIQAAQKTGQYAIGVDSDQDYLAQGHVLTSMMKRLDIATYTEVKKIILGRFKPGTVIYGLRQKGVGLSPMKFTKHLVSDQIMTRLNRIEQKIVNGEIIVSDFE